MRWDDSAIKQERDTIIKVLVANKLWLQTLGIEHIGLFGSFARGDAGPNSDIDLVVDIKKSDRPKGLFGMAKFRMILLNLLIAQGKLNRDVDVVEWQNIKPELHETMTAESIEIF